jgi:hypothetical protein
MLTEERLAERTQVDAPAALTFFHHSWISITVSCCILVWLYNTVHLFIAVCNNIMFWGFSRFKASLHCTVPYKSVGAGAIHGHLLHHCCFTWQQESCAQPSNQVWFSVDFFHSTADMKLELSNGPGCHEMQEQDINNQLWYFLEHLRTCLTCHWCENSVA